MRAVFFKYLKRTLLLLLFFSVVTTRADITPADSARMDKSTVQPHLPQKSNFEKYRNDSDFEYVREYETDVSWWEKFMRFLSKLFGLDFNYEKMSATAKLIVWSVAIATICFGIYWLFRNEFSLLFRPSSAAGTAQLKTKYVDLSMDVLSIETLLQQAIAQKNYAEAVRLYYTLALKELAESGLISFRIDKTNHEYIIELNNAAIKEPFGRLTYFFEYVFYGKFEATEDVFNKAREHYGRLSQKIKGGAVA